MVAVGSGGQVFGYFRGVQGRDDDHGAHDRVGGRDQRDQDQPARLVEGEVEAVLADDAARRRAVRAAHGVVEVDERQPRGDHGDVLAAVLVGRGDDPARRIDEVAEWRHTPDEVPRDGRREVLLGERVSRGEEHGDDESRAHPGSNAWTGRSHPACVVDFGAVDERASVGKSPGERIAELEAELAETRAAFEEKTSALEAANHELRSLTTNLDQIVRQRTRALAESESQLRRKNQELDRLNRMKTEFISIAAHELRTPMTSVVGYLDLLLEGTYGDLTPEMKRPLLSLRRNAHRLRRLIEDMLDVSRIESGQMTLHRHRTNLGEIVLAVLDELKPLADEKRQKLGATISDIPAFEADGDKIHQVVANLVANSIKYTRDGGEIAITLDTVSRGGTPTNARLRVWDNGIGIPPALRERIFEPFSDVNTAKHHTSNSPDSAGLGLHIARGIVDLHGGSIQVDSVEGEWTEFTILLPLAS